ncbi:dihydrodipicolinate synthase family protein [Buchananella hordeovulneris]|uniref:Dihydrodipicolinate synthase family protein n=1 Tax=Buchananella hordeovulneris TaxID=52770 RepID=A0A1Q5PWF5_9ACTO|nr:dihydrodipicolinate synthase family protein [Buchananella hordeovulneris]MDO5080521.1 dihydrodipicolinate synthase family protein [Buchananella hordeovulneris]OKL51918.1 dihydrodipicolinate synthase family protein [Buchananella hordeovulneris]RRD44601.1 dihydrodipicolinate synthase family protein [Buchananella hordeovulneris]RRD51803.1 dihydrodipicolinate synthase family protein [Buchananella hordeovulneris]
MTTVLRGVVPPVVTPLTETGRFDEASFARNIERQLAAGVHGLFVLGSSGEVAFSTTTRRREVLAAAVRITAGRVPILAGVIDTQTERVIEHIRDAEELGVDGVVATAPFYALGGEAQVERHFRALRAATQLPIYAYDIPVCVHVKLSVDLLMRLAADGIIQGVKDSSGDDVSFRFLVAANRAAGSPLTLLTGHEVVVDGAYLAGADGCVPGLGNVDPAGYVRQWDAYQAGDWQTVRAEQDRLADLMRIVFAAQGISGYGAGVGAFKTALQLLGVFETNQMPEPVARLTGESVAGVRAVLVRNGLLEA